MVHPRERLSYWREAATKTFVGHEFKAPCAFTGVRAGSVGNLGLATFECDPCQVDRSARHIARDEHSDLVLCLQVRGRMLVAQSGREATVDDGHFVLIDTARPYTQAFETRAETIVAKLPRELLEARIGNVASALARTLSVEPPVASLASGFLALLATRVDQLDGVAGASLSEQVLDLLALALSAEMERDGANLSSARAMTLRRLKSAVEHRLCDPDLKPTMVAREVGISVRYANALLLTEGTSLERYILARRLQRCRRLLADPKQAHRLIGEIAFACGFSDVSHFARRFKAEFGMAASDYRRQGK